MRQAVADEVRAATRCMAAAMNNLAGPFGKAYGRCMGELYYACFHLASALLASKGIAAGSHEAVQKLLALHFVKPAALPQGTVASLNEQMDKRHVADYKPYIAIGAEDIARQRPWIASFVRDAPRLLGKAAPRADADSLIAMLSAFEAHALEP
jgi:uncharacterized protein (UPF0332 family)